MLRLLIDQDFDQDILRGLVRRIPELNRSWITGMGSGGRAHHHHPQS
jgi:hypothetical protein